MICGMISYNFFFFFFFFQIIENYNALHSVKYYILESSFILYLFSEDEATEYSRGDHVVIYIRNSGGYIAAALI